MRKAASRRSRTAPAETGRLDGRRAGDARHAGPRGSRRAIVPSAPRDGVELRGPSGDPDGSSRAGSEAWRTEILSFNTTPSQDLPARDRSESEPRGIALSVQRESWALGRSSSTKHRLRGERGRVACVAGSSPVDASGAGVWPPLRMHFQGQERSSASRGRPNQRRSFIPTLRRSECRNSSSYRRRPGGEGR